MTTATPGRARSTRVSILEAAERLFCLRGIQPVGVDLIVAEAGVAKMTLYKHFESKDLLAAEVVRKRSQAMRDWLVSESRRRGEDAAGQILALFDALAEWFEKSEFRACLALNTTLEIADPEHPARVEAMNHKVAMRAILEDLAIRAGAERPKELGDQLLILIHGSIALAAAWKSPAPALRAKQVARVLLDA